jgi:hypothetical protein
LLNPVENLLFTIGVESGMLPSLSWRFQSMYECRLHRTSWVVECHHSRIDRNRNVLFPFCDITNRKICWHRNWNCWKVVSLGKIWPKSHGMQNWARRGKRSRVIGWALRMFVVKLPYLKSDVRITCQCRYRAICQGSSRRQRQNAKFDWINKQE